MIGSLHRVKKKNLENQSYSYFEDRVLERKGSIKLIIDCMLNISQTNTDSTATNEYLIAHIMTPVGSRQIQADRVSHLLTSARAFSPGYK